MAFGIIREPKICTYPLPKSEGVGKDQGAILGRVWKIEQFPQGHYYRFIDRIHWRDGHEELRFGHYYCNSDNVKKCNGNPKPSDKVWIFGQRLGHMSPETFAELIKKAKKEADHGSFGNILDNVEIKP